MLELVQKYEDNNIWLELVSYDFANKNHRDFSPLFEHVKNKILSLTASLGVQAFYEWKKAHRLYSFFSHLDLIVPTQSKQWITTQNDKMWDVISGEYAHNFFRILKNQLKNPELSFFFKSIFGGYTKNSIEKEKIIEKIDETKNLFEKNITKSKAYYFIPKHKKYLISNFSSQTLFKAHTAAIKKNWDGYYFTLNYETVYKLLTFISDRGTREEIYLKFNDSMNSCQFQNDNQKLLNKGLILKKNLANLYGYNNYSNLIASKYMVTLNQTEKFLNESEKQINEIMNTSNDLMLKMLKSDGFSDIMQPWDFSYYQRLFRAKYFIDTKIEEHFLFEVSFPKILKQMEKIFNVSITYINTVQENIIYEIKDNLNIAKSSFWIVAPFSRKKLSGAFEMDFVNHANIGKQNIPWIQFIYLNLDKSGKMPFLTVKNTIHEIGHAFHSFFSQNEKVKETFGWDLIELPSQFLENLAYRYDFLAKITSSTYLSKKIFKQEMKNYTFTDIFYLKEKIIDFKTSFELNRDVNPHSNKKIIQKLKTNRHSVGNYYNPFYEVEHFSNSYEYDYFSNYVYFFSENIAKQLNLIYEEKDFRNIFLKFDLDKKDFKKFIQSKVDVCNVDLVKMFSYNIFNKSFI